MKTSKSDHENGQKPNKLNYVLRLFVSGGTKTLFQGHSGIDGMMGTNSRV